MAIGTNGIATWGDLDPTYVTRGETSRCPTKSAIRGAVKSDYQVNFSGSYSGNQLVRYSDINFSSLYNYIDLTSVYFNGSLVAVSLNSYTCLNGGYFNFDYDGTIPSDTTFNGTIRFKLGTGPNSSYVQFTIDSLTRIFADNTLRSDDMLGKNVSISASATSGNYPNAYIDSLDIYCSNPNYRVRAGSTLSSSKIEIYLSN